ncbi:MAG: AAA family ATPase [Myxococcaceae bacterium]|nr:AAA family ATPase [Myxococcaceae bacterium]
MYEGFETFAFESTAPTQSPKFTEALQQTVRHDVTPELRSLIFEGKDPLAITRQVKASQIAHVDKVKEYAENKSDKALINAVKTHFDPRDTEWATKWVKELERTAEKGATFKEARRSAEEAVTELRDEANKFASQKWFKDPTVDLEAITLARIKEKAPAAQQHWYAATKKAAPAEGDLELAFISRRFTEPTGHETWVKKQGPDLTYGETLPKLEVPTVLEATAKKKALINKLSRLGLTGDNSDMHLLEQVLAAIDERTLQFLTDRNYTITVARDSIANTASDLRGVRIQKGLRADHAEGAHTMSKDKPPRIVLRTYVSGGKLQLDVGTLLHEIGHALDFNYKSGTALISQNEDFVKAFTAEHKYLPTYFHDQKEFFAEVYALYARDPEQCGRDFPLTTEVFKKLSSKDKSDWEGIWGTDVVDGEALTKLQRTMREDTLVQTDKDPVKIIRELDAVNALREKAKSARQPLVLELEGDRALTRVVAKRMADHAVLERLGNAKGVSSFRDTLIHLDAATFNDATALRERLDAVAGGSGAFVYIDDLGSIKPSSPGFAVLREYGSRRGDLFPLVLAGSKNDREPLANVMKGSLRKEIKIEGVSSDQAAELVRQEALKDGYVLTDEAMGAITKRLEGGDHDSAIALWGKIKQTQHDRLSKIADIATKNPQASTWALARDVEGVAARKATNPIGEIRRLIGQEAAKAKVDTIMARANLAKEQDKLGLEVEDPPRLNLLFAGNPGTGKTTFATLLTQGLFETGFTKSAKFTVVTVQDLTSGNPATNVKRLWEENKDGAIFLDEMHQLADDEPGRLVLRALIPKLTDLQYKRTVFIGAGYTEELLNALRKLDPGAERRLVMVPFVDNTKAELGLIADKMLADAKLTATPEVRAALLQSVDKRQRSMRNPGNGGNVETELGLANERKMTRLNELLKTRPLTQRDFTTLTLSDVQSKSPFTVDEVWAELNAKVPGLEDAKSKLRDWQYLIELNKELKQDPWSGVEPYFVLQGPAGTGAEELAGYIGKLGVALDLVPEAKVAKATGSDMLGGFVGDSTAKAVRKQFENGWGKTLYIEQLGAVGNAVGGFETMAGAEIVAQLKAGRGHTLVVIHDTKPNVDAFFRLDPALPSLFGNVWELNGLKAESPAEVLYQSLNDLSLNGKAIARGPLNAEITRRLGALSTDNPAWNGKADITMLARRVKQVQARLFIEAREKGRPFDVKDVQDAALKTALDDLERQVSQRPNPNASRQGDDHFKFATQTARQVEMKTEDAVVVAAPDKESQKVLNALTDVSMLKAFKDKFNTDPASLKAAENDVNSAYMKEVAKRLGVSPKRAHELIVQTRVKVKKLVEVNEKKLLQKFDYHCPFCGGINSPTCAYINYPLDWKVSHSTKKPWTEEITVKSVKEIETEELQEKKISVE